MDHYTENISSIEGYRQIDIILSLDCTLRCEYCYVHKSKEQFWDKKSIMESLDRQLDIYNKDEDAKGVVFSIFPEAWVNVKRTDDLITDILKLVEKKYPRFFDHYMIMIGTNGVNLHVPIPILEHLGNNLSVGVTVDGIKEQHDRYRVFANGSGSWDIVVNNVRKYRQKYNINSTKVTIGPETIKYIFDSTLFLWNDLGLSDVNMNVVYENIWNDKEQSLREFEDQLSRLYQYVVENRLWEKGKYTSIIGYRNIPQSIEFKASPYCGAAEMRSIDVDGSVYPCMRFLPFNQNGDTRFRLADSEVDRTLKLYSVYDSADEECLNCEILSACPMCSAGAYSENKSIYTRTKHHCQFQKLQYKYAKLLDEEIRRLS